MSANARTSPPGANLHVVLWGTYDRGKPRVRILEQGLEAQGVRLTVCHRDLWSGVEDKSQIRGFLRRLGFLARWALAYPGLILRYLRLSPHDAVLVCYLGQLDVLVLWPFARLRGVPVVWDAFLSLYDTVVEDRRLIGRGNPLAWLLYAWEWLACHASDRILTDTEAHGDYFAARFGVPRARISRVFVGAETDRFPAAQPPPPASTRGTRFQVLFYGQFIPLHGVETIVDAARLCRHLPIDWLLIGNGQEAARIRAQIAELPLPRLRWEPWVPYGELAERIRRASCCLGIFGTSAKAARVIPNKAFQVLAVGRPLVTRDSPAIRELLAPGPGVVLVPPGDPVALAQAIGGLCAAAAGTGVVHMPDEIRRELRARISPRAVGAQLLAAIREAAPRSFEAP